MVPKSMSMLLALNYIVRPVLRYLSGTNIQTDFACAPMMNKNEFYHSCSPFGRIPEVVLEAFSGIRWTASEAP